MKFASKIFRFDRSRILEIRIFSKICQNSIRAIAKLIYRGFVFTAFYPLLLKAILEYGVFSLTFFDLVGLELEYFKNM